MTYALILKENGTGCDYTIGCGQKLVLVGPDQPTGDEIYEKAELYGIDRIESIKVVKIIQDFDRSAIFLLGPETEDEPEEDESRAERHRRYLELKREFG